MANLTNKRLYLDYNATSPLAKSVIDWISKGDYFFANPSSIHAEGKKSKRLIKEVSSYLLSLFKLEESHDIFFHSGATEATNSIIMGFIFKCLKENKKPHIIVSEVDHSCAFNLKERVELLGGSFHTYPVDRNGEVLFTELSKIVDGLQGECLVNYTYVNNETGVVNGLDKAIKLKEKSNIFVHVDAVQSVGKIKDWCKLSAELDSYTYSGHKFGAYKGIGFTFIKEKLEPLIIGGGQQRGMRSGTENIQGIYSLKLSLEDLMNKSDFDESLKLHTEFENRLLRFAGGSIEIAGSCASQRSLTTTYILFKNKKADIIQTALDLASIDVSTGSACSSGAVVASRVLIGMGYNEDEAKSAVRVSLPSELGSDELTHICERLEAVFTRFI